MKKLLYIALSIGLSSQLLSATSLPLTSGKAIDGAVKQQEKKYYNITVPKNKSVRVNLTGLEADVDLYVKKGNEVRVRFNDCYSSNSNTENEECVVTNEGETSTYSIMVNGFKASAFNLKATVDGAEDIPTLTSDPLADAVEKKEGKQYKLDGKKGETITVTLSDLTADADLRVRVGRKASLHSFNCKSNNGGTKNEECVITPKKDATVYVHVYGYKAAAYTLKATQGSANPNLELINKAKEHCLNKDNSTDNVLCSPKEHLAYILIRKNDDAVVHIISTINHKYYGDWEYLGKNNVPNGQFRRSMTLHKLENTRLFYIKTVSYHGWVVNFYYSDGIYLKSAMDPYNAMADDVVVKTYSNGKKLSIIAQNTPGGTDRSSFYDIRDISNIKKLDKESVPCITLKDLKAKINNNDDVTKVNTSCITDMSKLFKDNYEFNQDIGNWDVSHVTNMFQMFYNARSFNQDINKWDVSNVTDMSGMLYNTFEYERHDLSKWNVKKVTEYFNFLSDRVNKYKNIEPKWKIKTQEDFINTVAQYCASNQTDSYTILCSNEPDIAYAINYKTEVFQGIIIDYLRINLKNNTAQILEANQTLSTFLPIESRSLKKFKDTPVYLYIKRRTGADKNGDWLFQYQGKTILGQSGFDGDGEPYDIHVSNKGKNLIYTYQSGNDEPYGTITETYDISNPSVAKLIDTKIKPLR